MKIIISPAKKMRVDTDSFPIQAFPQFLDNTQCLLARMRELSYQELKTLWKCNEQIAALNFERLQTIDLRRSLTPALMSYVGIQYQHMAPDVFTRDEFRYIEEHLRILSGFYGVLRPFDGVVPYRLEMGAKLDAAGKRDLYAFWGNRLSKAVIEGDSGVLNLASKEYSKCVIDHLPGNTPYLNCIFAERKDGKLIEKGTLCKMARGEMVRWMAREQVENWNHLKEFRELGYVFTPEESDGQNYVFIKQARKGCGDEEKSCL